MAHEFGKGSFVDNFDTGGGDVLVSDSGSVDICSRIERWVENMAVQMSQTKEIHTKRRSQTAEHAESEQNKLSNMIIRNITYLAI